MLTAEKFYNPPYLYERNVLPFALKMFELPNQKKYKFASPKNGNASNNNKTSQEMSEQENKPENKTEQVDLSELSNIQFATAWTPSSNISPKNFTPRKSGDFKGPRRDGGAFRKPREGGFSGRQREGGEFKKRQFPTRDDKNSEKRFSSDKPFKKRQKPFDKKAKKEPFVFSMEILFYPEDAPFNKLSDIMKASKRTYQLFDIAEIILEKPERFVVLAKNLPDADGKSAPLYCAQPLNLPFDDEASAKSAALEAKLEELFNTEEIDAEPPKGEFQVVNRCSITGDLLGAPNWHRYGEFLREYHNRKFPKMPFEKFCASIESVRDKEQISAWLEMMKKKTVFKLKEPQEGAPESFDTRESAFAYISQKYGSELVKTYEQVRLRGEYVAKLPFGRIRKNIEEACKKQKKFPIVTANNLRGRLRRSGFTIYKRGSKGFAYVSVIKRKFIFEGESLSEVPQKIFDFISANPAISAADLPYKYLGLDVPKSETETKSLAQQNTEGAQTLDSQKPSESAELSEETKAQLSSVWSELLWLVSEGYVVEYSDGTLQANPYLPKPKDKSQTADLEAEAAKAGDEPIMPAKKNTEAEAECGESESGETPQCQCESSSEGAGQENGGVAAESAKEEPCDDSSAQENSAPETVGDKPCENPESGVSNEGSKETSESKQ